MFDATNTQKALVAKGLNVTVDGQLGPKTMGALLCRAAGPSATVTALRAALATALVAQLSPAGIDTPLRVRHMLAQAACETASFTTMVEKASGMAYEGRHDLGNIYPGDGPRYKGRGLLDTTGRWNYQHLADLTGIDCVKHPELLEVPDTAVKAAVIYWNDKHVNALADADDIEGVTREVNGGLNGLSDRKIFFDRLGVIVP